MKYFTYGYIFIFYRFKQSNVNIKALYHYILLYYYEVLNFLHLYIHFILYIYNIYISHSILIYFFRIYLS